MGASTADSRELDAVRRRTSSRRAAISALISFCPRPPFGPPKARKCIRNAFKKAHDRYQRKCHRASSSRLSQDPARTIVDPTIDTGDQQP
ncbi:hypothetical protein SprV_0501801900 [Sparganum proliferum]